MDTSLNKQAEIAFKIINASATAKAHALEAVEFAKEKNFDKSLELISQARDALGPGSAAHGELVQYEAQGNLFQVSMLLMHSEDQLLNTETIIIMAEQLIEVYKKI